MKFRYWWQETSLAIIAIVAVLVTSVLIFSSLRLHMADMKWQMQKTEFLDGNMSKMFLLARFVDQYKLYQDSANRQEMDEHEFQMNLLFDSKPLASWGRMTVQDAIDYASLQIVNALRKATGKPPLADPEEVKALELMERAFRLERVREYGSALSIYNVLDAQITDTRLRGIADLHRGFCLALLGEAEKARARYEAVIANHRDNDLGVTATLLLRHLEVLLVERVAVLRSDLDDLTRARKMTALLQCREVLASFDPAQVKSPEARAEVLMLRARCEEELGERSKAVDNYTQAIKVVGATDLARDANRRLFILGSQVQDGGRIKAAAVRLNRGLKDAALGRMQKLDESIARSSTKEKVEETTAPQVLEQLEEIVSELAPEAPDAHVDTLPERKPVVKAAVVAKPVKRIWPAAGTSVKVELQDGKTFVGRVLSEPKDAELQIQTMIGVIGFSADEIVSITPQ